MVRVNKLWLVLWLVLGLVLVLVLVSVLGLGLGLEIGVVSPLSSSGYLIRCMILVPLALALPLSLTLTSERAASQPLSAQDDSKGP